MRFSRLIATPFYLTTHPSHYRELNPSSNTGSYIAIAEGHVVAVALTCEAARARAHANRAQRPATSLCIAPAIAV